MALIRPRVRAERMAVYAIWLLLAATVLLTLIAAPYRFSELSQPCVSPRCLSDNTLPRPEMVRVLQNLDFKLLDYAVFHIVTEFIHVTISWLLAAILLLRHKPDRMTFVVAISLSLGGFSNPILNALPAALHRSAIPVSALLYAGHVSFVLVYYLFPDGRFIPSWTRWLALVLAINELLITIGSTYTQITDHAIDYGWFETVEGVIWLGTFLAIVATQIYRFQRVSTQAQKAQTRWVVFGISISLVVGVALVVIGEATGGRLNPGYRLFSTMVGSWIPIPILLSLGMAILRYRLWDIDLIIRRTLVYSVLTALLAGLYFGGVTLLQSIFASISGQSSTAAIVISTLAIAAMFTPLRRRLQDFIDRRFYRQKYDADKALSDFATAARSQADINQLTQQLTQLVQNTMQPEQLSLWLSPGAQQRKPTEVPTKSRRRL